MTMHNISDRQVHVSAEGEEIVRYDRQGHWYIEMVPPSPHAGLRRRILLGRAVERAKELVDQGGTVHFGEYGGGAFDRAMRS